MFPSLVIWWFSVVTVLGSFLLIFCVSIIILCSYYEITKTFFIFPNRHKLQTHETTGPLFSSSQPLLTLLHLLPPWICLWYVPHTSGVKYLWFCVCLISLSVVSSRSIHRVSYIKISFLFYDWIGFYCVHVQFFIYSPNSWWTFGLFPPFGCCKQCCSEQDVQVSVQVSAFMSLEYVPGAHCWATWWSSV